MPIANDNIHIITTADPPMLFHYGEGFERYRLPVGTRVVYPNAPLDPLADPSAAIHLALNHPLGSDPLDALLAQLFDVLAEIFANELSSFLDRERLDLQRRPIPFGQFFQRPHCSPTPLYELPIIYLSHHWGCCRSQYLQLLH